MTKLRKDFQVRILLPDDVHVHMSDVVKLKTRFSIVTDSSKGMCVDPGEMGAALQAGGVRGPGPPEGEKGGQLASDSGRG
jgi:hypothetical protein